MRTEWGPYYFDRKKGDLAVAFFRDHLSLVDGEWYGRPFVLSKWQAHHTRQIFGWRRKDGGQRRYRRVRGWVPRKNGKTEWFAGLANLLTVADGEPGAQVVNYATDKAQAAILFEKAKRMARGSEYLLAKYSNGGGFFKESLFSAAGHRSLRLLSGAPTGKHGLNLHAAIGDECHEWRDGRLHTFLVQSMAARRQPLDLIISTAGIVNTFGHQLYLESMEILAEPERDPECYVFCYQAEPDDDWTDPKVWAKANPNLGISVKRDYLESECRRAQESPRLENDFKRYHLNMWVEQSQRWLPMLKWPLNTERPSDPDYWKSLLDEMRGRPAFGGVDIGATQDFSALVWVFPPLNKGERTVVIPRFFLPEATVASRDSPRLPYRRWVDSGAIIATDGNVADLDAIEDAVRADMGRFQVLKVGLDQWNALGPAIHLEADGVPVTFVQQSIKVMNSGSRALETLFSKGGLEHGNHPVLKWMFGNAVYRQDREGLIKPDKMRAADKIDGVVAAVNALCLLVAAAAAGPSVYETRGLLEVDF